MIKQYGSWLSLLAAQIAGFTIYHFQPNWQGVLLGLFAAVICGLCGAILDHP